MKVCKLENIHGVLKSICTFSTDLLLVVKQSCFSVVMTETALVSIPVFNKMDIMDAEFKRAIN